jgi:cellulose synthase/poly-beta-1,6-N-acetylglucosamine synthase-like glycosyltransferase
MCNINNIKSKHVQMVEEVGHTTSGGYAILYQREAFKEVGGWKEGFVGEDWATGIALRAQSDYWTKGKRIGYVKVIDNSPLNLERFQIQQKRWAKGGVETSRKLMPAFVKAKHIPWNEKADMIYRFTNYPVLSYITVIAPVLLALSGLSGLIFGSNFNVLIPLKSTLLDFVYPLGGLFLFDFARLMKSKKFKPAFKHITYSLPSMMSLSAVGLSVFKGVMEGFQDGSKTFHVTPKGRVENKNPIIEAFRKHYREIAFGVTVSSLSLFVLPWQVAVTGIVFGFMVSPFLSLIRFKNKKPK